MMERFTDRARKAMQLAQQEATQLNHDSVGTEHVLLGLVKEGSGVAANVLNNLGIDLEAARKCVSAKTVPGHPNAPHPGGKLPHTPRCKKVIEYAISEARELGYNYVGTEHLLLGLIQEGEGIAAQVLTNLGVKLTAVRAAVKELLESNQPQEMKDGINRIYDNKWVVGIATVLKHPPVEATYAPEPTASVEAKYSTDDVANKAIIGFAAEGAHDFKIGDVWSSCGRAGRR